MNRDRIISLRSGERVKNWNIDQFLKHGSFSEFYLVSKGTEQGVLKFVSCFLVSIFFYFKFLILPYEYLFL